MRISLAQSQAYPCRPAGPAASALFARAEADLVLGTRAAGDGVAEPVVPSASSLFGPRAACLASPEGPLFVSDTGHHRLLAWRRLPEEDHAPADLLVGQPDFGREGRNAKGAPGAATLNVPTGVAAAGGVLAVADAWNHRVLLWLRPLERSNQPADLVLGQADFAGGLANRGAAAAGPATLNWCYGVTLAAGKLFVADTGNRRVLVWDRLPTRNGAPADLVLGQRDFASRDENAGAAGGPGGMRWPHAVALAGGRLLVADAGNNRVMVWERLPTRNGEPCDFVLGQPDLSALDHNRSRLHHPGAATMNMPYGLAVRGRQVLVADTANSRLLGFAAEDLAQGRPATALAGQPDFASKGDNRWGLAARDSLCWPYGVAACGGTVAVADSGNNRVLLWREGA